MNKKTTGYRSMMVRELLWQKLKIIAAKSNLPIQDITEKVLALGLKHINQTNNDIANEI